MIEAPTPSAPYGKAVGLLAASVVTLIGVWRNLSPDVLLARAAAAGLACGLATRVAVVLVQRFARGS
jgi:hypothetical protein